MCYDNIAIDWCADE